MSWSISAIGRPAAVADKVQKDLANIKCAEPEETVRQAATAAIVAAVGAQAANSVVKVYAAGHQTQIYSPDGQATGAFQNNLQITVEPIYGFVE